MKVADNLEVMSLLDDIRNYDLSVFAHSLHVCDLSMLIAKRMELENGECDELYTAALLHDYGKIYYPKILLFKEGRFTDSERALVQLHVELGLQTLQKCTCITRRAIEGINQHHERLDGTGYPLGITEVGLFGRIIGVADIYDALTQQRCYKSAYTAPFSIQMLKDDDGKKYDKEVVHALECIVADGLDYSRIDRFVSSDNGSTGPDDSSRSVKI